MDPRTMLQCTGYAAASKHASLKPIPVERRDPGPGEVQFEVLYCGVCHSDLHQVRNDWGNTIYPSMPGHEIIGRVTKAGGSVTRHKVGDLVGVGCMVDSCLSCRSCREGLEQYCEGPKSWTATYNGPAKPDGTNTVGGYSTAMTVREEFVLSIPAALDPAKAAPLLCAGVTTYSPLRHWKVGPGQRIGVAGLGGLGHLAVQIAHALGAEVVVLTTTEEKRAEAKSLGAVDAVDVSNEKAMAELEGTLDFVLSTIPVPHDTNPYLATLKRDGHMVLVGLLGPLDPPVNNMKTAFKRQQIGGSLIGGIAETQEVLEFCAKHKIEARTQTIRMDEINEAFETMNKGDVRFRYVIDMASLHEAA